MTEHNIVSVSGGKDSTALLLLAKEQNVENLQAVFADTGHEHPATIEYVAYLNEHVYPIKTIKADFTRQIEHRRNVMQLIINGEYKEREGVKYRWTKEAAQRALEVLKPTGNPFLDLCLVHGRFPSTKTRFCSKELKQIPLMEQAQKPLLDAGIDVISWQGVRADESLARRNLAKLELKLTAKSGAELWHYRPILDWTAQDCFDMHKKHGIKHNPLYELGMGRVGCMPCIHARKDELFEISKRFPEEIERVSEWERIVQETSKTHSATFFAASELGAGSAADFDIEKHGIWAKVEWSKTSRGGRQIDMIKVESDIPICSSIYGLCE